MNKQTQQTHTLALQQRKKGKHILNAWIYW